jgi:quercetin dioxygenase-like cupin family protein/DNA-binding XRE family transcriptional regulator
MAENNSRMEIASRIRELRESVDTTPEVAAVRLGISLHKYLDFESGRLDVPISALYEIAGLFGVDMTDLLTGKSPNLQHFCVVREGKGPEIERFPGYRFQSLAFDFQNRKFEPLMVSLEPAKNQVIGLVTHGGQEFNLILKGRVRVILGGQSVDLATGDSIYFDPTIPHGQLALDETSASFLTVIFHENQPAAGENKESLC